jgi:hypothetical protein
MANLPPQSKRDDAWVTWFEQQKEDSLWSLEQPEIRDQHAGQVVVLHHREVIGAGRDNLEALEDARQKCQQRQASLPPHPELVFVSIPEPMEPGPSFFSSAARAGSQANGPLSPR